MTTTYLLVHLLGQLLGLVGIDQLLDPFLDVLDQLLSPFWYVPIIDHHPRSIINPSPTIIFNWGWFGWLVG